MSSLGDIVVFETASAFLMQNKGFHEPRLRYEYVDLGFDTVTTLLSPLNMAYGVSATKKPHDALWCPSPIHKFPWVVTGETFLGHTSSCPLCLTTLTVQLITSLYIVALSLNTIMALKSWGTTYVVRGCT